MLAEGDVATAVVVVPAHTHIATFVLSFWVTLLGTLPLVSTFVITHHPSSLIWTVAGCVSLSVGGVGGTILRQTFLVTWL